MSTISAELQLKIGQFSAAASRVDSLIQKMGSRTLWFNQIGHTLSNVFGPAMDAAAQFGAKMKGIFDLGGEVSDLAANTGMAASQVMVLRQAFANAGLGADGVGANVARLQKALSGVNEEGQSTNAALQRLGLAAGQLDNLSAVEQIKRLQQSFAMIEDPAMRTRAAMELFGKSGAKMLALLGDSSALTLAGEQVGALGALMDANAGKFDNLSDNLNTIAGLKMDQFFAGFAEQLTGAGDAVEKISKVDLTFVGGAVATAAKNAAAASNAFGGWMAKIMGVTTAKAALKAVGFRTWGDLFEEGQMDSLRQGNAQTEMGFADRMADEKDRALLLRDVESAAAAARAKLAGVNQEWGKYGPERVASVTAEIETHIRTLDMQAAALRSLGDAAAESGEQQALAAKVAQEQWEKLVETQKQWAKGRKDALAGLPKFFEDEELATPEGAGAKRKILLDRVGLGSVAEIDKEIMGLQKSLATGNYSGTGKELDRLKALMSARPQVASLDRVLDNERRAAVDKSVAEIDKSVAEKQRKVEELLDPQRLPAVQEWGTAARRIGLGGAGGSNVADIQRLQAERQREANGLLAQIRNLLKNRPAEARGEMVFS